MRKIKILTIILAIILITAVAFGGVYVQNKNRMENKIKDNSFSMDLKGTRVIRLEIDDSTNVVIKDSEGNTIEDADSLTDEELAEKGYTKEEVASNSEEVKNKECYRKSKEVLEKRLKEMNLLQYTIKLDEETGTIVVEVPENEGTDTVVSQIATTGKFKIQDNETDELLMDNSDIKSSNVLYGNSSTETDGTNVYLNIQFTKEGAEKLKKISNDYKEVEKSEDEEAEKATEGETEESSTETEKKIKIMVDESKIMESGFEQPIETGNLSLTVGTASTDKEVVQKNAEQALGMAVILDTGNMPNVYKVADNGYIESDITNNDLKIVGYVIVGLVAILLLALIVKYKSQGILVSLAYIGQVSLLMLTIKYANVELSIEGIFGIVVVLLLNYMFVNKLLSKLKKEELTKENVDVNVGKTYKEFFMEIIPVCILTIVFCFIKWSPISSFGMVMFWGITLIAIYNFIVTNNLLKIKAKQ